MKIFINYRREDEANMAFAIANALMKEFGVENVFFDRQAIQIGSVFPKEIEKALEKCRIFIPIIGKEWMNIMKKRRSLDEKDYVLQEIGHALKRSGIIVIPVLIDDTEMPLEKDMPSEVSRLSYINAINISSDPKRLPLEVKLLITEIKEVKQTPIQVSKSVKVFVVPIFVALAIAGVFLWINRSPKELREIGDLHKTDSVNINSHKTENTNISDKITKITESGNRNKIDENEMNSPVFNRPVESNKPNMGKRAENFTVKNEVPSNTIEKELHPVDLPIKLNELAVALSNSLEQRSFDKTNFIISEILSLDRDNIDAINAQAILDKQTGIGKIKSFKGPGTVTDVCFLKDGLKIMAEFDGIIGNSSTAKPPTVIIWDIDSEQKFFELPIKLGRKPRCITLSPDEQNIVLGNFFGIYLISLKTKATLGSYEASGTECVSFLPGGNRAISGGHELLLWDFELGSIIHRFKGHEGTIQSLAITPDGKKAVTGGQDAKIRLWDLQKKNEIWCIDGFKANFQSIAISPDGKQILAGGNKLIRLLDLNSGKEILSFAAHKGYTLSIAFSPDGRRALSGGTDNILRYWDLKSGSQLRGYKVTGEWTGSVGFSSDGRYAFSSDIGNINVWVLPK